MLIDFAKCWKRTGILQRKSTDFSRGKNLAGTLTLKRSQAHSSEKAGNSCARTDSPAEGSGGHAPLLGTSALCLNEWTDKTPLIQYFILTVQFSSVAQSCLTLCNPMDCSTPGLPIYCQLPEFTQTHVRWVGDAIQPSHPLSSPSPPAFNLSQHQGLFKWVSSSHQVVKVLEFQLQHQSFQWIFRTDFL